MKTDRNVLRQFTLSPRVAGRGLAPAFLLLASCWVLPIQAQTVVTNTIYQDLFTGSAPLAGRTPDTVDVGTNTWLAGPDWSTDGTEAVAGSGTVEGAFLPFVPQPGRVYYLSANLDDPSGGNWIAMGFAASANLTSYIANSDNAVGWQLIRDDGNTSPDQCFMGPNTAGASHETGFLPNGLTNVTIALDTRPAQPADWTFTFLIGCVVAKPAAAFGGTGPAINDVALGCDDDPGIIQDFTLTDVVPASAPFITSQPLYETNFPGDTVTFSFAGGGYPPPVYQWELNSAAIRGATNTSLVLTNVTTANVGSYFVVISNALGSITSSVAMLAVVTPVAETFYSDTFSGASGPLNGRSPDTADAVGATWIAGAGWLTDGTEAATSASGEYLAALPLTPVPGRVYSLSADIDDPTGGGNWLTLGFTSLATTNAIWPPNAGSVAWQLARDDGDASANQGFVGPGTAGGQTETGFYSDGLTNYTILLDTRPAQPADWTFTCLIGGQTAIPATKFGFSPVINYVAIGYDVDYGVVQHFKLSAEEIPILPSFTKQPQGGIFYPGEMTTLSAVVSGSQLAYQWLDNSNRIPGATNTSLTLTNLALAGTGNYQLVVTNSLGSVTSAVAQLVIANPPTSLNLSTDLVLHLKFDKDFLDYSGRGNNATNEGASLVPGIIGSGALEYQCDGNSVFDYATLGRPSDLLFSNKVSFTVSYWIQYTNVPDNQLNANYPAYVFPNCDLPIIGNAVGATYSPGWVIAQGGEGCENNPGAFVWTFNDTSATAVSASGPGHSEDDGLWHNLVHVFDWSLGYGTTYLDGVEVDATSIAGLNSIDTTNAINIGSDATGAYASAGAANLDDLSIWRRALSGDEARSIYEAGLTNHAAVASQPLPLGAARSSANVTVTWSAGILQSASQLMGSWTPVSGAQKPAYTNTPTGTTQFFRATQ